MRARPRRGPAKAIAGAPAFRKPSPRIPAALHPLFWDVAVGRLRWERDRDFVVGRILEQGGLIEARVLRDRLGDAALREWMIRTDARGLSPARVRFWELVLDLPKRKADGWVQTAKATVWEDRHSR